MRFLGGRIAVVGVAVLVALVAAPIANAKKPVASIADTQVTEPEDAGDTTKAKFTVSLSREAKKTVRIKYDTGGDTASPGDYVPDTGKIKIAKGKDKAKIKIVVNGDDQVELDEQFRVSLYKPKNAKLDPEASTASGTIFDSD